MYQEKTQLYERIPIVNKERLAFIDRQLADERKNVKGAFIKLHLVDEKNEKTFTYQLDDTCIIGRSPDFCDVVLDYDRTVSSRHCKLYVSNGELYATNISSTNPTYRNHVLLDESKAICDGDILGLGRLDLRIHME